MSSPRVTAFPKRNAVANGNANRSRKENSAMLHSPSDNLFSPVSKILNGNKKMFYKNVQKEGNENTSPAQLKRHGSYFKADSSSNANLARTAMRQAFMSGGKQKVEKLPSDVDDSLSNIVSKMSFQSPLKSSRGTFRESSL